jgi:hypothetical protein
MPLQPFTIKIVHRDVQVRPMTASESSMSEAQGMYDNDGVIYIDADKPPNQQAAIFLHELLHAIHDCWELPKQMRDEEGICTALDVPLATVFRDNPRLFVDLTRTLLAGQPLFKGRPDHDRRRPTIKQKPRRR